MGYLFLLITILAETAAVICMKLSAGFSNKLYASIALFAYLVSFVFLTLTLKHLPAGTANAIWAGASAVLVAVLGIIMFNERLTIVQSVSLVLIVIGLVGLNMQFKS